MVCSDSCSKHSSGPGGPYAKNKFCQDGGDGAVGASCAFGTDCTDCGARFKSPPPSPQPSLPPLPPSPPPSQPPLIMEWKWPAEHGVDCKDYPPRIGGGQEVVDGYNRGKHPLANACDSSGYSGYYSHTFSGYGVTGADYVDFIFTFDNPNTWCSGYRQSNLAHHSIHTNTKDIQISTSDDKVHWTLVTDSTIKDPYGHTITDTHSTWKVGAGTNTFPDDGTTTEWTPKAPSKYLRVRTLSNHGDTSYGGRVTVRFLQLKFAVAPY